MAYAPQIGRVQIETCDNEGKRQPVVYTVHVESSRRMIISELVSRSDTKTVPPPWASRRDTALMKNDRLSFLLLSQLRPHPVTKGEMRYEPDGELTLLTEEAGNRKIQGRLTLFVGQ